MGRFATTGLMLLIVIFAGTTAYFATKATVLEGHVERREATRPSASATPTGIPSTPAPSSPPTSQTVSPSNQAVIVGKTDHLSVPTETYTVAEGDTLYPIGLKYNMAFERIAEVNSLTEPYKLKVGQVLIIPTIDAKQNLYAVQFATDPARAQTVQQGVSAGKDSWRLDPVQTTKAENYSVFGISAADDFKLVSSDVEKGTALVGITRLIDSATKTYEVHLVQIGIKGANGIWAIESIRQKNG